MNKLLSLTIGIPVYNEEKNILNLIESIMTQERIKYSLREIVIVSDGSTDKTISILNNAKIINNKIRVLNYKGRMGKAHRLNKIYQMNTSELILTLDGDVILGEKNLIDKMINEFIVDKQLSLAVANQKALLLEDSFIGRIIHSKYLLWDEVRRLLSNNGDSIYNVFGSASMLKKSFSKSFKYPARITNDGGFLYVMAKKDGNFKFIKDITVLYVATRSIAEARMSYYRAENEREPLEKYLGCLVSSYYQLPIIFKVKAVIRRLKLDPFYTFLSLCFMIFLKFSNQKDKQHDYGKWQILNSTKKMPILKVFNKL